MIMSTKKNKTKKPKRFTEEEDKLLAKCVAQSDPINWNEIAKHFDGRTTRQVRERWTLYLSPDINIGPWSEEEDRLLLQKINQFGFKWAKLVTFFCQRSQMALKNRWNSHIKRAVEVDKNGVYYLPNDYNVDSQQIRITKQLERQEKAIKILKQNQVNDISDGYVKVNEKKNINCTNSTNDGFLKLDENLFVLDETITKMPMNQFDQDSIFIDPYKLERFFDY